MQANQLNKHVESTEDMVFNHLWDKIEQTVFVHPIILGNHFTQNFAEGNFSIEQLRNFTVQFSVFSNLFLVAQLKKMINAPSLESMRSSKEILASEIGVLFDGQGKNKNVQTGEDFMIVPNGSIDGGVFRFKAAHFEWLLKFGHSIGLNFNQMGKRSLGSVSTVHFTDKLEQLFGSEDPSISAGASFAIEQWANKGFWKELIQGLKSFSRQNNLQIPLGFFVWHDVVEGQHAEHTEDELRSLCQQADFTLDADKFVRSGIEALDALKIFWEGMTFSV